MDHYRCYHFWTPETRGYRIAQTARFFPTYSKVPIVTSNDATRMAAQDLTQALLNGNPQTINLTPTHMQALRSISKMFEAATSTTPHDQVVPKKVTDSNTNSGGPPRVGKNHVPPPRVGTPNNTTESNSPTSPSKIWQIPLNHQRHTRSNTPMTPIPEEVPKARRKKATAVNRAPPITTLPRPPTPHDVPATTTGTPPRRSTRARAPRGPIFVSQAAVYHVLASALEDTARLYTPTKMVKEREYDGTDSLHLDHVCNGVVHPVTGETITKYKKLIRDPLTKAVWERAMCYELGRLSQGYLTEKGTNTVQYLTHKEILTIPTDRVVTYARIVVDYRPHKADPNRVRITAGGNLIEYPHELTTRTADLVTTKLVWNSVLSTKDAKYLCADIKNMYLATPMDRFEYMRIPTDLIPEEFMLAYRLHNKVKNGHVYLQIEKGMYGLPQAGILANKLLQKRLKPHGYYELPHTPGLWKHISRPVQFSLVVDDFGIKYVGEQHAQHLLNALKEDYEISEDWKGKLYCGITLQWNYEQRHLDISMPGYTEKQLTRYKHVKPTKPVNTPLRPLPRTYGASSQQPTPPDESPLLNETEKKFVQ